MWKSPKYVLLRGFFLVVRIFEVIFLRGLALCPEKLLPVSRVFRNVVSSHFQGMQFLS